MNCSHPPVFTKHTIRSILTAAALALAVPAVHAKDYNVELVLFKYTRDEYFNNENWPNEWPIPDTGEAVGLDRVSGEYRDKIRPLNNSGRTLSAIVDSLEKSSRYEVMTYKAWRQPGLDKDDAVDILIRAGDVFEKQSRTPVFDDQPPTRGTLFLRPGEVDESSAFNRLAAGGNTGNGDTAVQTPLTEKYVRVSADSRIDPADRVYELEGTVKIVLSRFLHIYTDLLLMQPVQLEPIETEQSSETDPARSTIPRTGSMKPERVQRYRVTPAGDEDSFTTLQGVHIDQHRRMRSDELHHLDHPLLGIIVKATPAKEQ